MEELNVEGVNGFPLHGPRAPIYTPHATSTPSRHPLLLHLYIYMYATCYAHVHCHQNYTTHSQQPSYAPDLAHSAMPEVSKNDCRSTRRKKKQRQSAVVFLSTGDLTERQHDIPIG